MPGKLQNKRSSTLNNPPSAGTLDAGEIALNTNADSANLHFEDAGGGVRSIGADPTAAGTYVRNVSGANEVGTWTELEIPPGTIIDTDPPVDPPDGQLFFNEDNQTLWVWSEAQSTWAPAVPQVPTGGGGDYSSAELTEKVFFINEQEVNEDYTVTGTDNAGSFGPIDIANGKNVTIADGGTWTVCGGAGRSVDPAGLWSRDGSTGTLTPANPGDDIETTGDLSATDGEFTGEIIAAGKVKANAFERETLQSNGGINLSAGKCFLRQDGAGNNVFGVFQGGDSEADNMTFSVTGSGSITTTSDIVSGGEWGVDNETSIQSNFGFGVRRDSGGQVFAAYKDAYGDAGRTVLISSDGSISAAGGKFTVDVNGEVTVGNTQALRLSYNDANARVLSEAGKDLFCRTEGQQGCIQQGSGWVPAASERKLKTDITAANADDCWDSIKGIQLHNFYYRTQEDKTGVPYLGPIVDELETTNPDLVINAKASKTFNQPLLEMKAIQALQTALTRIEALEAKLTALSGPSTTDIQEGN